MIERFESDFQKAFERNTVSLEALKKKTVLITGATGLIGRVLVRGLQYLNDTQGASIRILALARNREKAERILLREGNEKDICLVEGDVTGNLCMEGEIDYIIHAASMTASKSFIEQPVEVAVTSIYGTRNILELAKQKHVTSVVYLSSMEVYGFTEEESLLTEDNIKYLNPLAVRSCYPESKRMCETLCSAYVSEYQVPVKIVRLAQTFGYGVERDDTRVFAEFARCVLCEQDIVLHTEGKSKRMYLDTIDAFFAIMTVLLYGRSGDAYNAANKSTFCSIVEMAEMVADELAEGDIKVRIALNTEMAYKYSPAHQLMLDVSRLEGIGWKAQAGLKEMFLRLLEVFRQAEL